MPLPPYQVYRDQLTSLFHGHAIWDPDPAGVYEGVSVGDVGYMRDGYFFRMFNVLSEWNDPSNCKLFQPESYPRLELGPFLNIKESKFSKGDYHSRFVVAEEGVPYHASTPDEFVMTLYLGLLQLTQSPVVYPSPSISAGGDRVPFCPFPMMASEKMSSGRRFSRNIYEIMWTAGFPWHKIISRT